MKQDGNYLMLIKITLIVLAAVVVLRLALPWLGVNVHFHWRN